MSSYLYYKLDLNVFSDDEFNYICQRVLKEFDNITHYHKHLLDKDDLKASTGYTIKYTTIMKHAAVMWYQDVTKIKIDPNVLISGDYI